MKLRHKLMESIIHDAFNIPLDQALPEHSYKLMQGGMSQTTVKLSLEGKDYVISLGKGELNAKVAAHCAAVKKSFIAYDIPVATDVVSAHSVTIKKNITYSIAEFVKGKHIFFADAQEIKSLGEVLGRIHSIPVALNEQIKSPRNPYKIYSKQGKEAAYSYVTAYLAGKKQLIPDLNDIRHLVNKHNKKEYFRQCFSDLPAGYLHGDINNSNILFDNKKVSAVLDFEKSQTGIFLEDIAKALFYFSANKKGEIEPERCIRFFEGYCTQRQITYEEIQALPAALERLASRKKVSLWARYREHPELDVLLKRCDGIKEQIQNVDPFSFIHIPRNKLPHCELQKIGMEH